jgi:hypothetical protein
MQTEKEKYFALSRSYGLPTRCPLLNRCERRGQTLAIATDSPFEDAAELASLSLPVAHCIGQGPSKAGGSNNFYAAGLCPEVQLFEPEMAIGGLAGRPTTAGEYDTLWPAKFRVLETGHFSECAEYAFSIAGSVPPPPAQKSWLQANYQWIIGTAIAMVGQIRAFLFIR